MIVSDLMLDLDVFQGPFDLLLALVMREEIELAELPIAEVVVAYVEHAYDDGVLDLESASEFLVLIAALLEIKVRLLFPGEEDEEEAFTAEEAEAELLARLMQYRRFAAAARWLTARAGEELRVFRAGPAPLAPRPQPEVVPFSEDPWALHCGDRPAAHAAARDRPDGRPPPARAGQPLRRRVPPAPARPARVRVRRGGGGARPARPGGRVPGRARALQERRGDPRPAGGLRADQRDPAGHADGRAGDRLMAELTHTVEALLFVASEPLTVRELAALTEAPPARVERALDALGDRYGEGRSGVVLERVAGGYGFRASQATAAACARLVNRAQSRALSQAATETLAVVAYLGPVSRPEIARIRGVAADSAVAGLLERGLIEESGRGDTPGQPVLYRTTNLFERTFGLEDGLATLPGLGDFDLPEADHEALRARLHVVADQRAGQA